MIDELSLAQKILNAANGVSSWGPDDCLNDAQWIAAAVLRSLVEQAGSTKHWHVDQLNTIAAELEGLTND
jgi:Uri superfamily endonuclease